MNKNYYLGIDGGGTKTAIVIIDEDNQIVYNNVLGPSSLDTVPLIEIEKMFIEESKKIPFKVSSVFAGLGGISSQKDIENINNILAKMSCVLPNAKVSSDNDVVNALYGALDGQDGIVIIAGTGSVAFGKYARSGGYCYQEGDAGSAYYIGYRALQHLARVCDGRKERSSFSDSLMKEIDCYDYQSLAHYFIHATRTEIASLAPLVCSSNNPEALKIVVDAVDEIIEMIKAVHKRLAINSESCPFSIIGSLGNNNELYRKLLFEKLIVLNPKIKYQYKKYDASFGAALKARSLQ